MYVGALLNSDRVDNISAAVQELTILLMMYSAA